MERRKILQWLRTTDNAALNELWAAADQARRQNVGESVHLRGLIEASNYCARSCHYCGIRAENPDIPRYRLTREEILHSARTAARLGYGTVVIQAGEDYGLDTDFIANTVRTIKTELALAITLSLGERRHDELRAWRAAGADRYLLRFETSNETLYRAIHPPLGNAVSDRFAILATLREIGYEVGSGVLIGIPGQTYDDLANDLERFRELDLDMIGCGPFIPHPDTPLGRGETELPEADPAEQVPNTELMTYKVVALARLACPRANIPSTTALATLNSAQGRELGLQRGANIVMPNVTPVEYRCQYEIYPGKACVRETAEQCNQCIKRRILSLGRIVGSGRGDSPNIASRRVIESSSGGETP